MTSSRHWLVKMTVSVVEWPSVSNERVQEMCWAWKHLQLSRGHCVTRLIVLSDGENSIFELVRQTSDELPRAKQQVTPTASKGSDGRVEQANRAVEGMTRTIMQCLETR